MIRKPLEPRTIALFFGIAATLLAWISAASYWSSHRLVRSLDQVDLAHQSLDTLQYIDLLMESAESSVRDYVLTGSEWNLNNFRYARMMIPVKLREVRAHPPGLQAASDTLSALEDQFSSEIQFLSRAIEARRSGGAELAGRQLAGSEANRRREARERVMTTAQYDQRLRLRERQGQMGEYAWKTKAVLVLALVISLLLMGGVFLLLRKESDRRRHAESATQLTETFLYSIIDRIPYLILVQEAENLRMTLVNKAAEQWLGRSREDLLNSNAYDLKTRDDAALAMQKDRDVLRGAVLVDIAEETLTVAGREARLLHTQKIPIPDEHGRPAFLLTISEDITQRKQAARMLELSRDAAVESARLKAEFIRNMSHEIRTPLSIVVGMTSLLLDTTLNVEQRRFASTVKRAADGLIDLSRTLLDFSKIETGAFTLETRELPVRDIVQGVVSMLADQARAKNFSLVSVVHNDLPSVVQGDPARLRQVLTQLIGNAVKFTERGEVIVRVTEERQTEEQIWITYRISDTGIGIPKEQQGGLFDPFRQGDGSFTRRFGGTGLGLAISKRIVELMGGVIGFESVDGRGSTFWFTIPFTKRHVHGPVVQIGSMPWTTARVLVIDENETSRQRIQQQLRSWALASEAVSSGQTALELLRRERKANRPFPVVLLDMHLPDMDAVALAREVANDPLLAGTKLVAMGTGAAPFDAETGASLGLLGWVSKPLQPDDLHQRLAAVIDTPATRSHHAA